MFLIEWHILVVLIHASITARDTNKHRISYLIYQRHNKTNIWNPAVCGNGTKENASLYFLCSSYVTFFHKENVIQQIEQCHSSRTPFLSSIVSICSVLVLFRNVVWLTVVYLLFLCQRLPKATLSRNEQRVNIMVRTRMASDWTVHTFMFAVGY